ncbi:hypothetical protein B6V73_03025 [Thioclava sp. JM3]|nr:hypothetical protein B6V73_03025 [Thioclava sp. JM3]PWE50793.1 hypothetical protein DEM26_07825 [Thioclava sp. NG1]
MYLERIPDMMNKRTLLLSLPVALLTALPAAAQDEGLYPEPSSPDASFLRVIAPDADSVSIDGTRLETSDAGLTPYVEVSPGDVDLTVGDEERSVEVGASTHYTILSSVKDEPMIKDDITESPAQADLLLYNLSDMKTFDLYATEAKTAALSDVAPGTEGAVGLKAPLTLTFELRQDGETLSSLDPLELRRGTATTVIVGADGALTATDSTYAN